VAPTDARGVVAATGHANSHGEGRARIAWVVNAQRDLHRRRRAAVIAGNGAARRGDAQADKEEPRNDDGRYLATLHESPLHSKVSTLDSTARRPQRLAHC